MKKYKLKNSVKIIFFLIIVLIILFTLTRYNTSESYSLEYSIDKYDISENYDINRQIYYYQITKDKIKYDFIYSSELLETNKLIKSIKEYNSNKTTCITIDSLYINTNPLCSKNNNQIDYHLVNEDLKIELESYYKQPEKINKKIENYQLYTEENILIWNYKGFNYIKNQKLKEIKLFKKDIYEIPLATKINEYIVIPDYEQNYNFDKVYIINLNTLEIEEWELYYDISFNSYINGINDKSIFITDIKNSKQYELVPHKKKMRIVGKKGKSGIVYNYGISEKIPMSELIKDEVLFTTSDSYIYQLKDNYLYLNYPDSKLNTKISNHKVDKIIYSYQDNVYYLIDNILYRYNKEFGEIKIIEYEEWNYNNINPIFIDN